MVGRDCFRYLVTLVLLVAALLACGVRGQLQAASRIHEDIQMELGVESHVNVMTSNGKTTVTVALASPPSGALAAVKSKVTGIVKRHVPKADHVVVNTNL